MRIPGPGSLKLAWQLSGTGDQAIVLVHGFMGAKEDWSAQLSAFSRTHRLLTFDHRGHGASEAPNDDSAYTVDHLLADTHALIDRAGLERFHLVGHSIGGAIAQEIALHTPVRVMSLTLADTTDWFGDHDQPGGTPPYLPPELVESANTRAGQMSGAALRGTWQGLLAWAGTRDRASGITCPTLILYGARDASRIIEGSIRLQRQIPGARTLVIEGAGHSPHRERPDDFNAALRYLLDSV